MQTPQNESTHNAEESRDVDERKPRLARRSLRVATVVGLVAVGALTALYAFRPSTEPLESAAPLPASTVIQGPASTAEAGRHDPAPAVVVLTQQVFPTTHAVQYAGRQAELEGMMVTETVGDRFAYMRPATLPNEVPLLVDIADARDLELDPAKIVTVRGEIRLADEVEDVTALTETQRERLKEARIYLDATAVVAPPES